ncbi:LysR family transcriptional regulator (plasmid) [Cupriavidus necator]|uniref:LysR family transcriptional regulator n=1 Tax=Cupriavidus necator TaxID=106590 RepID=A0A367PCK9_CUPNE|nr:LysR substrate-binding domain-containing protein [Cupriavidus necator]QQX89119.1 LysR family transcriptional regulator [Cupriavidus necator]RCJ05618.1 LysR family transcriptional regulator [Cupriavidus necator]
MDFRQLRYFARIVELESITAAAEALHIAQPSLSQHVVNLEAELGAKLLVRGPFGARPTETGQILYRHAKMVLRQMEEAHAAVRHGRDVPSGHVRLGLPTSTSRVLALPLLQFVTEHVPDVTVEIVEGSSADLAELVTAQKLDLCISMDSQQRPNMHLVPLFDEDLMAVGPASGRSDKPLTLAEVAALPLLLPSFPNSVRVLTDRAFVAAGLDLKIVAETSAVSVLLSAVSAGMGWTILPWSALATERPDAYACVPISDSTLVRRVYLCVAGSARLSLACKTVEDAILRLIVEAIGTRAWQGVSPLGSLTSGSRGDARPH